MSKSVTTALKVTVLASASASLLIAAACKKAENKEAPPAGSATAGATAPGPAAAKAATPGVTATEIKIGQSIPYSGPASAFNMLGKGAAAYFKMINDKGGINGRKITFISLDDAYVPAKAVENTRKLVESEEVALIFNNVGTANNLAVQKYLNDKKVPHLFVASGADKFADPARFPWTMGFQPSYRQEAKVYAQYLLKEKPDAKLCVLYQNDDFGKEYLTGLREGFGDKHDQIVVKTASYEVTDPTIDSQIVSLQAAGCNALLTAATPKAAVGTIRKTADMGWKLDYHFMSGVSVARPSILEPAGLDKSKGLLHAGYIKDITDPGNANDPGLNEYRAFAKQYLPDLNINDGLLVYAYGVSHALVKVLTQCGDDLSRENIMKQAANLKDFQLGVITDGILINTSPTDYHPYSQYRLAKFTGEFWQAIGEPMNVD